ncbi:MAG: hypothetical protein JW828_07295 [Sedimentisphaerales bacterium]|nr:hypothetical protein [Sedimentisphaerales bacterium]
MASYETISSEIAGLISASFGELGNQIRRLSTGLRINGAADDAAGLAVREIMRADLATVRQSSQNIQDGVSLVQTAEAAGGVVSTMLARLKELSLQAMNGTLSDQQKNIIQMEFDQLSDEIATIGQHTKFNGIALFQDGQSLEIATGNGQNIAIETQAMPLLSGDLTNHPEAAALAVDTAIEQVSSMRGHLGASINRLESAGEVLDIQAESILAAESRISDVDMARETADLTRNRIIAESAMAAQAHADAVSQVALMLLG